jgi:hypothetical protein
VGCQTRLDVGNPFHLGLLGSVRVRAILCTVASGCLSLGLGLVIVGQDPLVVLLHDVFRDALHAEDLDV